MRYIKFFVLAVSIALLAVAPAWAGNGGGSSGGTWDPPLTVDGGWQEFFFGGVGSFNDEGPWTFSSATPTILTVTDAFLDGDQFNVYDNAALLGATSVPVNDGTQVNDDPDAAFASPKFSHGQWFLVAGNHSITIEAILSPYGSGAGYLRADTAQSIVPLPAAAWSGLALLGMMGIAAVRRIRR